MAHTPTMRRWLRRGGMAAEVFDIGIGEMLAIGVLALLIFGPDRLPTAAASAGRFLRQLSQQIAQVRDGVVNSAGGEVQEAIDGLKALKSLAPESMGATGRETVGKITDGL
jgi:Sec-independent protein translocase protein TatA